MSLIASVTHGFNPCGNRTVDSANNTTRKRKLAKFKIYYASSSSTD